jgi:hypothetical protein
MLPAAIDADWERIGALLAPAIKQDDQRQDSDVFRDLMAGDMALFEVEASGARGVVVVEIDGPTFWITYIAGRIDGLPRRWLERVRMLMSYFAGIARAHNCTELRIEGRDWSRVFPDWERIDERPGRHELRRIL